ncbi:hypothetical protein K439DRAFT_1628450 [Ramaria rubella]|nr:hypothetical protein K439DRAFT_1628450 [Ramaria rubella]
MMRKRFDILRQLPIPKDIPLDTLKPIGIPDRFTLHEFLLGGASGSLKNALSGYCAFTENTTMWCPEREEHGFYLTPLYKCDTGPRSNVIHRWMKVDIKARMPKPTECFYKKEGEWYYTGTYKSLRLEDLTTKEYDNLSEETRDALVKETLAGRKNSTPQVIFETSQLYAAGALKVAVVGIQCIGFNRMLYSVALQQAQRFQALGKAKILPTRNIP